MQRTDLFAVLSLACAVVGNWALPVLLGPAAVILGFVSLYRLQGSPYLKGKAIAVLGLIAGCIITGITVMQPG